MCSNCPCTPCDCGTLSCHQPCETDNDDRAELESRMRDFENLIGRGHDDDESSNDFEVPRIQTMDELQQEIEVLKQDVQAGRQRFLGGDN